MPNYVASGSTLTVNTQTSGDQTNQSVTRLSDGSLIVVWQTSLVSQDGSGSAIIMRKFSATGTPLTAEIVVNSAIAGNQTLPQVSALANGGFAVTWDTADTTQDGNGTAIKARIFDASASPLGGEFLVNTQSTANQLQPTITGLANGNMVVAWHSTDTTQDGNGWAVKAQIVSASGTPVGTEFKVNTTASGSQNNIDITALNSGGFVATWQTGSAGALNAQIYDGAGVALGSQISVTTATRNMDSKVTSHSGGGFVVAYARGLAVWFQRFDAAGVKQGSETYVGDGLLPDVTLLSDGDFVVGWRSASFEMRARVYSAAGVASSAEFVLNQESNAGYEPSLVSLSGGGFAALWSATAVSGYDIRMQQFQPQANVAPELGAATRSFTQNENIALVSTITATDDGGPAAVSYSIVGGLDAARFTINATTGMLSFVASPNFEAPTDNGANNVYNLIIRASDGALYDEQALTVTINNVNESPVITSNGGGSAASITVSENGAAVTTVAATDPENATRTYSISGGADAAKFQIDASTGALSFIAAPDFEAATDVGANNVYDVTVRVSDGVLVDTQSIAVTVTNANEGQFFTSPSALSAVENGTVIGNVAALDLDGDSLTYAIAGGADAALFAIDAATGALSFLAAPDFETPADAGADNVYDVTVSASDGSLSATQSIAVTVTNANEGQSFTSPANFAVAENGTAIGTVAATDLDGDTLTYAIAGGADAALFAIDAATGALSFLAAPDFEAAADADADNVYNVTVSASDGSLSATQAIAVTVTNANEGQSFTSPANFAVAENGTAIGTVAATDLDGDTLTYAIAGGADAALFAIDAATGALSFLAAPDFEAPADAGGDNVYDVTVSASDGSLTETQGVTVTVSNVNEGQSFTSPASFSAAENGTAIGSVVATDFDGDTLTYAIAGGADAGLFAVDAVTGALSFLAAPDFEAPADAGGDNVYDVTVSASDGSLSATQALAVTLTNVNEAVAITSFGGGATAAVVINENATAVGNIAAADPENAALTYAIAGGADAAKFAVNAVTGALSFIAAPNWEAPTDVGANNVYDVIVSVSDGVTSDTQTLAVTINNIIDGATINGTASGNTINGTIAEDTINGLGGNDVINAGAGADYINGGTGNDRMTGGAGADVYFGGTGADQFILTLSSDSSLAAMDVIQDFVQSQTDRINVNAIDANVNLVNNQNFSFIGTAAFSNVAGQLRYQQSAGSTYVYGDTNGDGQADFGIQMLGLFTLVSTNFVL